MNGGDSYGISGLELPIALILLAAIFCLSWVLVEGCGGQNSEDNRESTVKITGQ